MTSNLVAELRRASNALSWNKARRQRSHQRGPLLGSSSRNWPKKRTTRCSVAIADTASASTRRVRCERSTAVTARVRSGNRNK